MAAMQKFEYRNPRIRTDLPIQFAAGEKVLTGRCTDLSADGLGALLPGPIALGTVGRLTLDSPTGKIELPARVSYSDQDRVGIMFVFDHSEERNVLLHFLETVPKLSTL